MLCSMVVMSFEMFSLEFALCLRLLSLWFFILLKWEQEMKWHHIINQMDLIPWLSMSQCCFTLCLELVKLNFSSADIFSFDFHWLIWQCGSVTSNNDKSTFGKLTCAFFQFLIKMTFHLLTLNCSNEWDG